MNKPTFEEIKTAYQSCGYKPRAEEWVDEDKKTACGMSALAMGRGILTASEIAQQEIETGGEVTNFMAGKLGLSTNFVSGFVGGFDKTPLDSFHDHNQIEEFVDGWALGSEVNQGLLCGV